MKGPIYPMKTPITRAAFALLLAFAAAPGVASAAESPANPLLRSVLIDGDTRLFSLADATGTGTWVKLGASFGDWKLDSFDVATQTLTISRAGVSKDLKLETAQIAAAEPAATLAEADAVLQKMRFEEMIEKTLRAQQESMAKSMSSMGRMGNKNMSETEAAALADFQAKMIKTMFEDMDFPGMRKDMAKAMSEVFTPSELRAQADFYSTPAGQAVVDKQPELQTRMSEILMPRMMASMPKIQTMAKEFAAEQKAAKDAAKAAAAKAAAAPAPATP